MVVEKVGKLPVNSRIFIDYTKDPVKIDFEYPDPDKNNVRRSSAVYIPAIMVGSFMLLVLIGLFTFYIQPMIYTHISSEDITVNDVRVEDYEYYSNGTYNGTHYGFNYIYVNYTWNNELYYTALSLSSKGYFFPVPYFYERKTSKMSSDVSSVLQGLILIAIWVTLVILNSFWVSKVFTDTRWGNRTFPEINKKIHNEKFSAEFSAQDFPVDKNVIEIPLFKNMYMDYEATGDFAEHLQKISIIEHPFNQLIKKGLPFTKKRKRIIKKTNIYLWKCVVEFKDKPKDGKLILRWS